MPFVLQREEIDEAWRKVARLTHEGVLGSAAKMATHNPADKRWPLIYMYVDDCTDKVWSAAVVVLCTRPPQGEGAATRREQQHTAVHGVTLALT